MAQTPNIIKGLDIYKAIRGPVPRTSGCGAFRNRRKDKKLSRREGKIACKG